MSADELEVVGGTVEDAGPSGWDALAADYEEVGDVQAAAAMEDYRVTLDVFRGRSGQTSCVRYRWVSPSKTEDIAQRAGRMQPGTDQALYVACHTLALCCDEFGFRGPRDEEHPDGLHGHPDGAYRFDARLARFLGLKLDPNGDRIAQTVLHAFAGNQWKVLAQAREVEAWLVDPTREVNEAFLGG